jgi:hypothetical protein
MMKIWWHGFFALAKGFQVRMITLSEVARPRPAAR